MSLEVFNSYVLGYSDHMFDLQLIAVETGYWAGYYSSSKKPRPLKNVIETLLRNRYRNESKHSNSFKEKSQVDVDAFLAHEKRFKARLKEQTKK